MTIVDPLSDAPSSQTVRWRRAADFGLTFRASTDDDMAMLERIYGATRADELATVDWSDAQKTAFVAMQFRAQHTHYRNHYPNAEWLIIFHGDATVGRLYLELWPTQIRIIDIALLPKHRGKGFGNAILKDVTDEAALAGKDVSIHVEKFNPARRLYLRLGFVIEEDKGVYDLMRWTAVT